MKRSSKVGAGASLFPLQFKLPSQSKLTYNTTTKNLHSWEKRKTQFNWCESHEKDTLIEI